MNKVHGTQEFVKPVEVNHKTVYIRSNVEHLEDGSFLYNEKTIDLQYFIENMNSDEIKRLVGYADSSISKSDLAKLVISGEINSEEYKNICDDDYSENIDLVKEVKLEEMNMACSDDILAGFESSCLGTPHLYSYDIEAQLNLKDAKISLADDARESINWRIKDTRELLPHSKEQIAQLYKDSMAHKESRLTKYRQLEEQIKNSTDIEVIKSISW